MTAAVNMDDYEIKEQPLLQPEALEDIDGENNKQPPLQPDAPFNADGNIDEKPCLKPEYTWCQFIAGDVINTEHRKGNELAATIICVIAMVCSVSLCLLLFQTNFAIAIGALCIAGFYVASPIDLIPDDLRVGWVRLGLLDDLIFAVAGAFGLALLVKACMTSQIAFANFPITLCLTGVVVALVIACYFRHGLRWLCIGLWAMIAQAAFFAQLIPNTTIALGVALYCFGFIYNVLPMDLIHDEHSRFGKLDDIILGYIPAYGGLALLIAGGIFSIFG